MLRCETQKRPSSKGLQKRDKISNCRKMSPFSLSLWKSVALRSICVGTHRESQGRAMNELFADAGLTLAAVATVGGLYTLFASALVGRFMRRDAADVAHTPAVTILKPLHLGDPDLEHNLETFFSQTYAGPVQIVFGVHDDADPAIAVVQALQAKYPHLDTTIVAD